MTFNNLSLYLSQMHFPARAKTIKIFTDWRIFHSFAFSTLTVDCCGNLANTPAAPPHPPDTPPGLWGHAPSPPRPPPPPTPPSGSAETGRRWPQRRAVTQTHKYYTQFSMGSNYVFIHNVPEKYFQSVESTGQTGQSIIMPWSSLTHEFDQSLPESPEAFQFQCPLHNIVRSSRASNTICSSLPLLLQ